MIFNDNPLANEPLVYGRNISQESQCFNEFIRYLVVRFALLGWMESNVPALWKDVVESYFKKKGTKIVQTIRKWAMLPSAPPHMNRYLSHIHHISPNPTIASLIPRVQKGLQRFGVDTSSLSSIPVNSHQDSAHRFGGGTYLW